MDFYQRIGHIQRILSGTELKKYKLVLVVFKESEKVIAEDHSALVSTKDVTMEQFYTWMKTDDNSCSEDMYLGSY